MSSMFVHIPKWVQFIFNKQLWSIPTSGKELYLTFDDGPTPEITEWVLGQLKKHRAKATFFCIGKNVVSHPSIAAKIIADGHQIGNHTHNHLQGWKTTPDSYLKNVFKATETLEKLAIHTLLFRPPYGKITLSQVKKLRKKGYKIVMWDVLSEDYNSAINSEKCLQNILKHAQKGSIVVFHDSVKAASHLKEVLPKVLKYYREKGYEFKTLA